VATFPFALPILFEVPIMMNVIRSVFQRSRHRLPKRPLSFRPTLIGLEDRCTPSGNVLETNLVSDLPGVAQFQDPQLVNPWGIAESGKSPFWISDNNAGVSTLYNTAGVKQGLVVSIPAPGDPLGSSGTPTGAVFNIDGGPTGGFKITGVTTTGAPITAAAAFLFATEDGTIVGWNPAVNPTGFDPTKAGKYGIIAVDRSAIPDAADGAVYKGLAIATDANGRTLLYASNFRAGTVDVFDTDFKLVNTLPKGAFTDTDLPKGYAPFNVQVLNGKVYVTYAKQDAARHDDDAGPHRGFVDVFNLDGTPGLANGAKRLVSRGPLNSPWGLAIAPPTFGSLAGALLVGNFGDGHINAFDATTGASMGKLLDPDGEPIQIDGLWALKVGNGGNGGDAGKVYFTAGIDHEQHGLFGSLTSVAPGTPEGPAEAQKVQAALDVFQIDLNTVQQDIANGAPAATVRQDLQTLQAAFIDFLQAEMQFAHDARHDAGAGTSAALVHSGRTLDLDALFDVGDSQWLDLR
jgi:uncharacterized protein (TIGR03118 family)